MLEVNLRCLSQLFSAEAPPPHVISASETLVNDADALEQPCLEASEVAQLMQCLPSVHVAVGLIHSTEYV